MTQKKERQHRRKEKKRPRNKSIKGEEEQCTDKPCTSAHGHFRPLSSLISPFSFLSILERKIFGGPGRKHLDPTIYFPSSPPNQTHFKKVFLPIFSPKSFIHSISPPNKHMLVQISAHLYLYINI